MVDSIVEAIGQNLTKFERRTNFMVLWLVKKCRRLTGNLKLILRRERFRYVKETSLIDFKYFITFGYNAKRELFNLWENNHRAQR